MADAFGHRVYRKETAGLRMAARTWFLILLVIMLTVSPAVPAAAAESSAADLAQVRALLDQGYVDPVPQDVLNAPTMDTMLGRLGDPYTDYFSPSEYKDFQDSLNNQFSGIGIHMVMTPSGVEVASVIAGSPAEKAGLKPGDIVTRADARPLSGLSSGEAAALLRGPAGTTVQLAVRRGCAILFLPVTRAALSEPEVTGQLLDGHIGYLQVSVFGSAVPQAFAQAASGLQKKGADAWIVDLRENPGGYLAAALALAADFIPGEAVVRVQTRTGGTQTLVASQKGLVRIHGPVILLTDENSASASEVLTAALKDHDAAFVLGEKTFGKGSVQQIYPFADGAALKMTIAHFFSPAGHPINQVGIKPDLSVDPALAKEAAELLLAQPTVNTQKPALSGAGKVGPSMTVGPENDRLSGSGGQGQDRVGANGLGQDRVSTNGLGKDGVSPYGLGKDGASADGLAETGQIFRGGEEARFYTQGRIFTVPLDMARSSKYWQVWRDILTGAPQQAQFMIKGQGGWASVPRAEVREKWPLYFPGSRLAGEVDNPPLARSYTLTFSQPVNAGSPGTSAELLDAAKGTVIPTVVKAQGSETVRVTPLAPLQAGKTYWLIGGTGGGADQAGLSASARQIMQIRTFVPPNPK
ncbi:C-terminal-processing peptidase S41A [Acididesulfobacillus acetoxydans]|uniref:C-terminal-processing peptidase S41A n=1 Tax=Acididesulfobacillus acetoxydans TaxID=1561005 RepID=A0A8S0W684_9FIRM|nr:C-terminal-processing peptidase S41A [Acididesulfobacillus acetoxydans]CEJ07195.1 Carboxyl-terminal-processing protease [Acididesulfobacillus acetoxydans]